MTNATISTLTIVKLLRKASERACEPASSVTSGGGVGSNFNGDGCGKSFMGYSFASPSLARAAGISSIWRKAHAFLFDAILGFNGRRSGRRWR